MPEETLVLAQAGGGLIEMGAMIALMFGVVYFLMLRPQSKQRAKHQQLIESLKKGDEVVLSSGIIGKIASVEEKFLLLETSRDNKIRVLKSAVSGNAAKLLQKGDDKKADDK